MRDLRRTDIGGAPRGVPPHSDMLQGVFDDPRGQPSAGDVEEVPCQTAGGATKVIKVPREYLRSAHVRVPHPWYRVRSWVDWRMQAARVAVPIEKLEEAGVYQNGTLEDWQRVAGELYP